MSNISKLKYDKKTFENMLYSQEKEDWIEIKLIKKLIEIDRDKVFIKAYIKALKFCELLRKEKKNYVDASLLSNMGKEFSEISKKLLDKIYNKKYQQLILILIKEINQFKVSEIEKRYFLTKITQIFFHSKRLLTVIISPQIIEKFAINNKILNNSFSIINYERKTINNIQNNPVHKELCNFKIKNIEYICEILPKDKGAFFGAIIEIREKVNNTFLQRYYLKSHTRYPATNKKNDKESYTVSSELLNSLETEDSIAANKLYSIDLREPFIYMLLDKLGFGPKTYILINPYINYGLFIITEDLNSKDIIFKELNEINKELGIDFDAIFASESEHQLKKYIKKGLNLLNIITNIFELKDIKGDNIGFLGKKKIWDILKKEEDIKKQKEEYNIIPLILDFLNKKESVEDSCQDNPKEENNKINENREERKKTIIQYLIEEEMFPNTVENLYKNLIGIKNLYKSLIAALENNKKLNEFRKNAYSHLIKKLDLFMDNIFPEKVTAWKTFNYKFKQLNFLEETKNEIISIYNNILKINEKKNDLYIDPEIQLKKYVELIKEKYKIMTNLFNLSKTNDKNNNKLYLEIHLEEIKQKVNKKIIDYN